MRPQTGCAFFFKNSIGGSGPFFGVIDIGIGLSVIGTGIQAPCFVLLPTAKERTLNQEESEPEDKNKWYKNCIPLTL
jgi:hypothetical protein